MQKLNCAICGKKQQISELYPATFKKRALNAKTFSARRTPDRMHYRFVRCHNCGLIFSNPILPAKDIAKLYKDSDFYYPTEADYLKKTYGDLLARALGEIIKEEGSLQSLTSLRTRQKVRALGSRQTAHPKSNIRLLDIGCGNGFFLEAAKEMGIDQVYGVEPGVESVQKAPNWLQKRIKIAMFKPGLYRKNSFDIVCCFHTLDHIVDPRAFLKEVRKVLKPGGKALFVVHNTDGLSVKLFGEKSAIFDIEHIYLFNKQSLSKIFQQHGFGPGQLTDITNRYPLQYWLRMVPIPFKKPLLKLLAWSKIGSIPIAVKAGNICIITE